MTDVFKQQRELREELIERGYDKKYPGVVILLLTKNINVGEMIELMERYIFSKGK